MTTLLASRRRCRCSACRACRARARALVAHGARGSSTLRNRAIDFALQSGQFLDKSHDCATGTHTHTHTHTHARALEARLTKGRAAQALKLGTSYRGPGFNGRQETFPSYIHVELSRCAPTLAVRAAAAAAAGVGARALAEPAGANRQHMGVYALEAVKIAQTAEQQKYAYEHALAVEKVVGQVQALKLEPNAVHTSWSALGEVQFALEPVCARWPPLVATSPHGLVCVRARRASPPQQSATTSVGFAPRCAS